MKPHMEKVDIKSGMQLAETAVPPSYVHFPEAGVLSLIATSPEGQRVESGLLGRDGFAPHAARLEGAIPRLETLVQVPGHAYRIPAELFRATLKSSPEFALAVDRSLHVLGLQVAYTALSNGVHHIDERLARWLLMCHDRVDGDVLSLTHEFISLMLAVRRPSVTTALHTLEGNHLIRSERGTITVRDRRGLEEFAADAYGVPEVEYRRWFGDSRARA
jgi:CRP-like cAMP-binding protein